MITITPDTTKVRQYLKELQTKDLPRVVGRTIDRTRKSGASFLSRDLRQRLNLKKAVIDRAITTRRSNEIQNMTSLSLGRAWFEIRASGDPIPLRDYAARETRRGVTFKVARKGGRKRYVSQGQTAFIVARLGGHVFVRKGPEPEGPVKIGIRKVYGPAIPHYLATRRQRDALIKHCAEFWGKEGQRNIEFALRRRGNR